jgi:hypothetical protein
MMHWGFALGWVGGVLLWAIAAAAWDFKAEIKARRESAAKSRRTNDA